jgi:NADPH:quinone reductase-like Zn-dependent oxidoreductase
MTDYTKTVPQRQLIRRQPDPSRHRNGLLPIRSVTQAAGDALKPIIDRTFKFDDMVEVHRYLENSGQFGKIVVTL